MVDIMLAQALQSGGEEALTLADATQYNLIDWQKNISATY